MDPKILDLSRHELITSDANGREVTVEEAASHYASHKALLSVLNDWRNGTFTVSITEYRRLPALFLDYRRLFISLMSRAR